jgi:ribosomal protein S27AE
MWSQKATKDLRNTGLWSRMELMVDQFCPECGGALLFDAVNKRFSCKSCGLFLTRDQLSDLRYKMKTLPDDERRKRARQQADYLDWWLTGNKNKQ